MFWLWCCLRLLPWFPLKKRRQDSAKTKNIEEVVITGALGIKKKSDAVTNAQQVVGAKELTQAAPIDAIQGLTGRVSGLQITQTDNSVNGTNRIILRGAKSITGNNEALIVIDNVISNATVFQQIPPEAIESVNVIKGLQGAALYGQQGVNGVIIVTTKKGSANERIQFALTSSVTAYNAYKLPLYQKKYGKGAYDDGWAKYQTGDFHDPMGGTYYVPWENTSWGPAYSDPKIGGQLVPIGLPQPNNDILYQRYAPVDDMYGKLFKTGVLFQNALTVNAGGKDSYALLSISRQENDFIVDGDKMKRNSFLFKAGKTLGNFSVDFNVNYISQAVNTTDPGLWYNFVQTPTSSNLKLFRNSGRDGYTTSYATNPYWTMEHVRRNSASDYLSGILSLRYKFNDHINVSYSGNIATRTITSDRHNDGNTVNRIYRTPDNPATNGFTGRTFGLSNVTSSYYASTAKTRDYYGDLMVNFDYDLSKDINLKLNVGNNIQDKVYNIKSVGGTSLDVPGWYHINNVLKPDAWSKLDNKDLNYRIIAGFANLDLSYKDYLFVNGTYRIEKSSVLSLSTPQGSTNNSKAPFYSYYSGGVSFVPTKAFKSLQGNVLNYFKIAANYTRVGNTSAIDPYEIFQTGNIPTGFPFNGNPSYIINANPTSFGIKPEFVATKDLNVQLGFFKDRITLEGSVYQSDTDDLITAVSVSNGSGLGTLKSNFGKMRLRGYEIDLGLVPIKTTDFRWDLRASIASSRSKILELAKGLDQIPLLRYDAYGGLGVYAVQGEDFAQIKGNKFERDPEGRIIVDEKGLPLVTAGIESFGRQTPDYTLNLSTTFKYKGFTLSALMDFRKGGKFIPIIKNTMAFAGNLEETADFDRSKGYVVPNSVQNVGTAANPKYVTNTTPVYGSADYNSVNKYFGSGPYSTTSEPYVVDATAFKIRDISLSYDLPKSVLSNTFVTSVTFGVFVRNPYIKYAKDNRNYADPETSSSSATGGSRNAIGIADTNQYPTTRSFGFNLKLTF